MFAAAGVNALFVLVAPGLALLLVESLRAIYPALASNTVHARPVSPIVGAIATIIVATYLTVPLATLAAWRTWVHATRWQMHRRTWWGVAEAGATGALSVMVLLGPTVLGVAVEKRSMEGIIAIVGYALIFGLVGLVVGLMLQLTAIAVLKIASASTRSH